MIDKLIRASIKNRVLVLVLTFMITLVGIYNAYYLSIDAIPDVTNVQVSAVTSSPGLSPLEVEQFITYPIEMEFTGLPNVTEIRSISRTGVSSVTVIFKDGTDIILQDNSSTKESNKRKPSFLPVTEGPNSLRSRPV
ncbi:RND transporter, Hydrophobe/Amphiphile Efflux-1 (HAE1)/Heavy Metal Efflux (HME) family, permease protein [Leptospira weilii serovar Topaz str. LT2116]|uniref:RND transporter, Hydrophobe/Amphiphile Efflux-1 (HAE1)/Heavy Metal Efflux (HME) family, permease protein n=1 Tax=Leptospira weilii serovar Topaz str. LT2116 TaxID=1088540 RepID=M3ERI6_9LEPT|nr:RND transporter, Hydrophobe/Amphiphile Efflux-1 (HAE1)/Heavy Metal Efflux (HME) family, permease protein [Leptospira weilii serovar Topaz str. LT2116]